VLCGDSPAAFGFLADHPKDVISYDGKFQHWLIRFKFTGWQVFQIHVRFNFTVKLFAFPMGMVKVTDFMVCHPKVCPPGIYRDVIWEQELPLLINGTVYDPITDAQGNAFFPCHPLFCKLQASRHFLCRRFFRHGTSWHSGCMIPPWTASPPCFLYGGCFL